MADKYSPKTDGSIYALNDLSIDDLEKELRNMPKDTLIGTCMKAIWCACMLNDHIDENNRG